MIKFLTTTGTTLALAFTLAAPATAQLLGGGLGGSIGGGLGIGGGLPTGSISGAGNIGVSGAANGTAGAVRSTTRVTQSVNAAVNTSVKAPVVAVPTIKTTAIAVPALPSVNSVVYVPAIPDIAVRRTAIIEAGIVPVTYAQVPAYVDHQYVVLQGELRGTGVKVKRQGQQIVLEMPSDVTFSFNKYNIQPRFYGVLSAVSRTLAKYPATYVDVNGHTDAIGSFSYNQVLSEKRADSVADFLAGRQVNPARMHTQGFGKTEPVASNATIDGRAANRRVEIILTPYAA